MRRLIISLIGALLPVSIACSQSQSCSSSSRTVTFATQASILDTAEHKTGNHGVASGIFGHPEAGSALQGACTYSSSGNQNCDTSCGVTLSNFSSSETGALNTVKIHQVGVGWANGTSAAASAGASCTGTLGGAAVSCFGGFGTCFVTLSVSPGSLNLLNTNGTPIWQQTTSAPFSCPAVADPTWSPGGGGGGPVQEIDPGTSPIIIDIEGEGFHLTSAANGVLFDIRADGHPIQLGWTDPRFRNAFLALPGTDGLVHNGTELFGNFTPQPASPHPNGFLALAEYDKPENGGNNDGVIDERDAIFSRLRLWIDDNHDGVSQPNELHTLQEFGVYSLSLNYFESRKEDQWGNEFRYRARVNPDQRHRDSRDLTGTGEPGRWTYDVFLTNH